jgi:DnaJ-class molecular chaperone
MVRANASRKGFSAGFSAYCTEDCRDGMEVHVAMASKECPACAGGTQKPTRSRWKEKWMPDCVTCNDTHVVFPKADTEAQREREVLATCYPCPDCAGNYVANSTTCTTCTGTGIDPEAQGALASLKGGSP